MDQEDLEIGLSEALGKVTAFFGMQIALIGTLIVKGLISQDDAATMTALAERMVEATHELPEDAKEMAKATLRGYAAALTQNVTKN